MSNKARNTSGRFALKSESPRKIRSVNLTDDAWQWLADTAEQAGMSRNDYLEAMAEGVNPFMETASSDKVETTEQPDDKLLPLMETVETLKQQLAEAMAENEALKASPAPKTEIILPDAATLLNELKKMHKKTKCGLPDMEAILDILES